MKVPMAPASWPVELPRTDVSTTKGTKDTEEGPCRAAHRGSRAGFAGAPSKPTDADSWDNAL